MRKKGPNVVYVIDDPTARSEALGLSHKIAFERFTDGFFGIEQKVIEAVTKWIKRVEG